MKMSVKSFSKIILVVTAILLLTTFSFPREATSQNTSTETKPAKISFGSLVNRDNLKARFQAYSNNLTLVPSAATSTTNLSVATNSSPANNQRTGKIKILVVPGHDNEYPGAEVGSIREADINLKISAYLKSFLEQENAFEVYITREAEFIKTDIENLGREENNQDKNGYTDYFQKYLDENISEVLNYKEIYKEETAKKFKKVSSSSVKKVEHNPAPGEMAYRLYAINKFIEDNQIDIVIHIHLNDYAGRTGLEGQYKGFSIYVPDNTLRNGKESQTLSKYISKTIDDNFKYSNNPVEKKKIILGHELIANGSNNTIQAASVLIEYGYIYEDKFQDEETLKKAAQQTYLGIKDYLIKK